MNQGYAFPYSIHASPYARAVGSVLYCNNGFTADEINTYYALRAVGSIDIVTTDFNPL